MRKPIFNVKEPSGSSVIRSASGKAVHVAEPLGKQYVRDLVTVGAMQRASQARKRIKGA